MKDLIVWGTGGSGKQFYSSLKWYPESGYHILGFTNSYDKTAETPEGIPFFPKDEWQLDPSGNTAVVIACDNKTAGHQIKEYLQTERGLPEEKILFWRTIVQALRKERIMKRYEHSRDPEILDTLEWLKTNELSVYNQFSPSDRKLYEVRTDAENGFPYIEYQTRRVYYPRSWQFQEVDGKPCVVNLFETIQNPEFPHCYEFGSHRVSKDSVIVDAGVAEGNFVLSHIDAVKKAYLFECDPLWLEALSLSLRPFRDKVVLVPKKLGACDTEDTVRLDSVVQEPIDFLKMDIEGAECDALLGGLELLRRSRAKLSVCTYHRQNDEKYVSFILQSLGYKTARSKGHMLFLCDPLIDRTLDFRHGILYGEKEDFCPGKER